jgi:hypothetical protein
MLLSVAQMVTSRRSMILVITENRAFCSVVADRHVGVADWSVQLALRTS